MASLYNRKYFHRDLSWLRFNHRVLQEASDVRNPLYERIKFLAIFSSNLDEFFKVRVSDIRQIKNIEKSLRKRLIQKPNKVLKEIKAQVDVQQTEFGRVFNEEIIPDLAKQQVHLLDYKKYSTTQKLVAQQYFDETISPLLKVQIFDLHAKNAVFVKNEALYLTALQGDHQFQFVEIPSELPRFFMFPKQNGKHYITFIDDVLKYNLRQTPKGESNLEYYAIKISRDAALYIEDEFSGVLKDTIAESLSKRDTGQATRVLMDQRMPKVLQEIIKTALDINKTDIVLGATYHNFKDFFSFPNPTNKSAGVEGLPPIPHKMLSTHKSMFDAIDEGDKLLHYPYQSFEPVIKLIEEAAVDKHVKKIRITIYRAATESRLNDAIALAAENGKEVTVFIEVKARFDERNNIRWGKLFEEKGAKVLYSYPDIKVHSKILLISREVGSVKTRYGYIATGNFNEKTASLYTDFGLMTSHKKITKELLKVFLVLDRTIIVPKTKRILVSPFTTRVKFTELINNEIVLAQEGSKARITLKMNSLEDRAMIKLLYRASNAGVKIRLLVRGICCLVPGIKGQSENIYVTSVIDRFLEHGRVYIFGNGGDELVYIGSADWMTRNLNHRIEVVTPIIDNTLKKRILDFIDIQITDNVKARIIDADQKNEYVLNERPKVQSQLATYHYLND
jgi:polyphosphate kinase